MKCFEQTWLSKDGLEIYSQSWEADTAPTRAAICLVHGLGEHCGRYIHLAEHLTSHGFAMVAFDLRGHGKSAGIRGHVASSEEFLVEIDRLLLEASRRYPDKPRFLYGHSLGGLLVLYYALKRKPDLAGVIASGAGLRSSLEKQALKIALIKTLASIAPERLTATGLNAEHLSRDPEVVRDYKADPLVHDRASFSLAKGSLQLIPWTFQHAAEFSLPLLLMHGTEDQITYPAGSQEFAELVKCDCTLKLWEGLYHETHNEPEKEEVMNFVVGWLESKI
jgi:acylglycerol lipase